MFPMAVDALFGVTGTIFGIMMGTTMSAGNLATTGTHPMSKFLALKAPQRVWNKHFHWQNDITCFDGFWW